MLKLDQNDTLLIIAPHPDDEVIGCAGLIQKVKKSGGRVFIIFLTNGDTNDFTKLGPSKLKDRNIEIKDVAKYLMFDGYEIAFEGNEYHLQLDIMGQKKLMNIIERESSYSIEKIKPTIIVFPSKNSYNQDHEIAARAAHACLRVSSGEKHFIKTVLSYEFPADFWSLESEPHRNFYVKLTSSEWDNKINALKLYKSQWRGFPSSRSELSLSSLAKLRAGDCAGEFAEGYFMHRGVLE